MKNFTVIEAFSGIGSQAKAINKAGLEHWQIINTIEWDINAIIAYFFIHHKKDEFEKYKDLNIEELDIIIDRYDLSMDGKSPMTEYQKKYLPLEVKWRLAAAIEGTKNLGSISNLRGEDLDENFDLLTYSFPCQDLSIAGVWHGLNTGINKNVENRSGMLWQVERILKEKYDNKKNLPKFLLMENVANILSKKHIGDFEGWIKTLEEMGYVSKYYRLNASDFGIPQNRERVFMVSVYVGKNKNLSKKIVDYLDKNVFQYGDLLSSSKPICIQPLRKFLRLDNSIRKYRNEADKSQPNNTPSRRKIWKDNIKIVDSDNNIANKLIPTITTKQDRNPNSGVIFYSNEGKESKSNFRYLTPRECFLLMGFEEKDYDVLLNNNFMVNKSREFFTQSKLIKMAGNSIVVDILVVIFEQIDQINKILIDEEKLIKKCI